MNKYMDKAMVYPFTDTILPVLQYLNVPNIEMIITTLIDTKRKFLKGKDAGYIKNWFDTGMMISDNFEEELGYNNILIYTDETNESISTNLVFSDIEKALRMQKKVICLRPMIDDEVNRLNEIASEMNTEFYYLNFTNQEIPETNFEYIPHELYEPKASVIMVGEMFRGLDGEQICLSLAREMKSIGYKCVTIMDQKYARVVGAHPFPSFLKADKTSESNKVYYLNNFIKHIDQTEDPDAIIILIPDPMIKYNAMYGNGFGIIPYILSQAIQADCFIFCTQFDDVEINLFDSLSINFENRFGFGIDFVHMSNVMLDIQKSQICGNLSFSCQTQDSLSHMIANKYQNSKIPIFNGLEKDQCKNLNCAVIEKLENYYQIKSALI